MKSISVSIFSLLAGLFITVSVSAQDTTRVYGLRVGSDVARIAYYFFTPSETGPEFSADLGILPNIFLTAEGGFQTAALDHDRYSYRMNGYYFRIGADYNFLKLKENTDNHIIYGGIRYGFSSFSQTLDQAVLTSTIWGNGSTDVELSGQAHWIGLTGGMKIEVLKNFFLGWSLQYNFILNSFDDSMQPLLIPGYGRMGNSKPVTVHYSIYYFIPLFRK